MSSKVCKNPLTSCLTHDYECPKNQQWCILGVCFVFGKPYRIQTFFLHSKREANTLGVNLKKQESFENNAIWP